MKRWNDFYYSFYFVTLSPSSPDKHFTCQHSPKLDVPKVSLPDSEHLWFYWFTGHQLNYYSVLIEIDNGYRSTPPPGCHILWFARRPSWTLPRIHSNIIGSMVCSQHLFQMNEYNMYKTKIQIKSLVKTFSILFH